MNVREERLNNDFKSLAELVSMSGRTLSIASKEGDPPYSYTINYHCKGIERLQNDIPVFRYEHQVEICLTNEYPRSKPEAKFLTPIFHPNVWENQIICLGSYWTLAETLTELVLRIGRIIQYSTDVLNLSSSANSLAKTWAEDNLRKFPIDTENFKASSDSPGEISWNDLS